MNLAKRFVMFLDQHKTLPKFYKMSDEGDKYTLVTALKDFGCTGHKITSEESYRDNLKKETKPEESILDVRVKARKDLSQIVTFEDESKVLVENPAQLWYPMVAIEIF